MIRRFLPFLLGAWLVLCAAGSAHAQGIPQSRRSTLGAGRFWGSVQMEWISVGDSRQRSYFEESSAQQYSFEAGMRLTGNFDLLGSIGYRYESAHQLNENDFLMTPRVLSRLTNVDTLHTIPMTASLRYRLQWDPDAWLVPYVRGGVTGAWFVYDEDTIGVGNVWGIKWGLHGGAGLLWRIDELDKNSRRSLRNQGIDGMYLDTGFHWQWVNNFGTETPNQYNGKGLDLSGMGARLGLTIWVR